MEQASIIIMRMLRPAIPPLLCQRFFRLWPDWSPLRSSSFVCSGKFAGLDDDPAEIDVSRQATSAGARNQSEAGRPALSSPSKFNRYLPAPPTVASFCIFSNFPAASIWSALPQPQSALPWTQRKRPRRSALHCRSPRHGTRSRRALFPTCGKGSQRGSISSGEREKIYQAPETPQTDRSPRIWLQCSTNNQRPRAASRSVQSAVKRAMARARIENSGTAFDDGRRARGRRAASNINGFLRGEDVCPSLGTQRLKALGRQPDRGRRHGCAG